MTLFGIALGLLELGLIAVFLIAMVISVSVDRRGVPHPKWIVTLLGIGGVLFLTRNSWTLSSLGDFVLSATFWVPLLKYLGAGLAYSFVEFARETRLSAKRLKDDWESFLRMTPPARGNRDYGYRGDDSEKTLREVLNSLTTGVGETDDETAAMRSAAVSVKGEFTTRYTSKDMLIKPRVIDGEIQPAVDKEILATNVGAWSMFWPFYLMSLIVGDLLAEVFNAVAAVIVSMSGRFVKAVFKDTFKL